LQAIARDISTRYNQLKRDNNRLVQVNLRNFSYYIPMKMDKPSVPTVFNQSVPYAAYEVVRRIHKYVQGKTKSVHAKEQADNPRPSIGWTPTTMELVILPYAKRPVLKDINLVLKPGRTYLVLGPPGYVHRNHKKNSMQLLSTSSSVTNSTPVSHFQNSCGKTTLLKAIAGRLRYRGDSKEESFANQPHREGRIEYNGVSTTVKNKRLRRL
jgi:hypothetical protein